MLEVDTMEKELTKKLQRKFTSKKDITKLLLKGCDCENCKFSHADSTKRWCKNQRKKPKSNVCVVWEKSFFDSAVKVLHRLWEKKFH